MIIFKKTILCSATFILLLVSISSLVADEPNGIEPQIIENPQPTTSATHPSDENSIQFFTIRGGFIPAVACGYRMQKNLLGFEIVGEADCPLLFFAFSAKVTLLRYFGHKNFNYQWYTGLSLPTSAK
ncbi:MAG: hypothetical protein K1060chlam2_01382 [Chlamydiae bacterium]|nr:hypothetical protein [Chlamydiota bacterium]